MKPPLELAADASMDWWAAGLRKADDASRPEKGALVGVSNGKKLGRKRA